jgi:hypothetical protein
MCFYCRNGLPSAVKKVFAKLEAKFPGAATRLGHPVFGDLNLDEASIRFCLKEFLNWRIREGFADVALVRASLADEAALDDLLTIPASVRDPEAASRPVWVKRRHPNAADRRLRLAEAETDSPTLDEED